MCVGSVVGLFSCVVWSLVGMFGGWLDNFSLVASLHGVYLYVVRGFGPIVPCLEHVRAGGGGGGSMTIGLCISLYRYVAVGHSGGCGCLGDHESL